MVLNEIQGDNNDHTKGQELIELTLIHEMARDLYETTNLSTNSILPLANALEIQKKARDHMDLLMILRIMNLQINATMESHFIYLAKSWMKYKVGSLKSVKDVCLVKLTALEKIVNSKAEMLRKIRMHVEKNEYVKESVRRMEKELNEENPRGYVTDDFEMGLWKKTGPVLNLLRKNRVPDPL